MTYGVNLRKVKLPVTSLAINVWNMPTFDIVGEQTKAQLKIDKLNAEQRLVCWCVNAIYGNQIDTPKLFFLHSSAGTGKTFVYSTLLHKTRGKEIAPTLLNGGRTTYSVFKIPTPLNTTSTSNVKLNTQETKLFLNIKLIIWNESPVTHVHAFIAVDRLLQDLTKCKKSFGEKVILLRAIFVKSYELFWDVQDH